MTLDDVYTELLYIVSSVGARIEVPEECEVFLARIVEQFNGGRQELLDYVKKNVESWFCCLDYRPRWIQEAEWQFHDGKPMMFLGQLDIAKNILFHDDASVFLFYSCDTGITKNVIQVS